MAAAPAATEHAVKAIKEPSGSSAPNLAMRSATTTTPLASTTDLRQTAWLSWAGRLGLVAGLVAVGAWVVLTVLRRPGARDLGPYTVVVQQQALRGTVVATGIVATINVEEGEQVRAGQVLVSKPWKLLLDTRGTRAP